MQLMATVDSAKSGVYSEEGEMQWAIDLSWWKKNT